MHLENTDNSLFLHHTLDSANMSKKLYKEPARKQYQRFKSYNVVECRYIFLHFTACKKEIYSQMQHLILLYAKNLSFIQQRIYLLEDISFKDNTVL